MIGGQSESQKSLGILDVHPVMEIVFYQNNDHCNKARNGSGTTSTNVRCWLGLQIPPFWSMEVFDFDKTLLTSWCQKPHHTFRGQSWFGSKKGTHTIPDIMLWLISYVTSVWKGIQSHTIFLFVVGVPRWDLNDWNWRLLCPYVHTQEMWPQHLIHLYKQPSKSRGHKH